MNHFGAHKKRQGDEISTETFYRIPGFKADATNKTILRCFLSFLESENVFGNKVKDQFRVGIESRDRDEDFETVVNYRRKVHRHYWDVENSLKTQKCTYQLLKGKHSQVGENRADDHDK